MLILPSTSRQSYARPVGPFYLNTDSPQSVGLLAWVPITHGITRDYVTNQRLVLEPGTRFAAGPEGIGLDCTITGSGATVTALPEWKAGAPFTLVAYSRQISSSVVSYSAYASVNYSEPNANPYVAPGGIGLQGTGLSSNYQITGSLVWLDWSGAPSTSTILDQLNIMVLRVKSGTQDIINNAVVKGSATTAATGTSTTATTQLVIGSEDGAARIGAYIYDVRLYNRFLSDADVWSLYDPRTRWDLYQVRSRRIYFDIAAAAAASTWPGYQSPFGWR